MVFFLPQWKKKSRICAFLKVNLVYLNILVNLEKRCGESCSPEVCVKSSFWFVSRGGVGSSKKLHNLWLRLHPNLVLRLWVCLVRTLACIWDCFENSGWAIEHRYFRRSLFCWLISNDTGSCQWWVCRVYRHLCLFFFRLGTQWL